MISAGDRVILSGKGKTYLVRAGDGSLGTDLGMVDLSLLIGKEPGDVIATRSGKELVLRLPRATDFFEQAKRSGAPMLPRDIGLVIGLTGMNKQDHVLDAGTGSGVAAVFFAGVAGKVTTCERREEFFRIAFDNIQETGLTNIDVVNLDVLEVDGIFDIVHLDLGITREHVRHAYSLIRPGGTWSVILRSLNRWVWSMTPLSKCFQRCLRMKALCGIWIGVNGEHGLRRKCVIADT